MHIGCSDAMCTLFRNSALRGTMCVRIHFRWIFISFNYSRLENRFLSTFIHMCISISHSGHMLQSHCHWQMCQCEMCQSFCCLRAHELWWRCHTNLINFVREVIFFIRQKRSRCMRDDSVYEYKFTNRINRAARTENEMNSSETVVHRFKWIVRKNQRKYLDSMVFSLLEWCVDGDWRRRIVTTRALCVWEW